MDDNVKLGPEDPRSVVFDVLRSVEERGAYADRALDTALGRLPSMDPRDRALATELVYGVLRRRGTLDLCLKPHLRRPLDRLDPEVLRTLRLGAYQILFLDRVPDHAAVNESVALAKRRCRPGTGALVNGCLRSLCREKTASGAREPLGGRLSMASADFPHWLVSLWESQFGRERALDLFRCSSGGAPETFLRVNTLKGSAEELTALLGEEGFAAELVQGLPGAVLVREGGDLRRSRGFSQGWFVQQDAASQAVVPLLGPRPGERVLDLCAAPGIKTTQIAERVQGRGLIVAVDVNPDRLRDLAGLCARMGASVAHPLCADPGRTDGLHLTGPPFDRVLVDAPCSGLGILRRNPERKWRPAPDFRALAALQRRMMDRAAGLVRQGGVLVYSTCTVNRKENEGVVESFLAEHPDFVPEEAARFLPPLFRASVSPEGFFCSWLGPSSSDLFFAARLRRT